MEEKYLQDNPAGRICTILKKLRTIDQESNSVQSAFCLAFGIENSSTSYYKIVPSFYQNFNDLEELIPRLNKYKYELYVKAFNYVRGNLMILNIGESWKTYYHQLFIAGEMYVESFNALAVDLSELYSEGVIAEADLISIRNELANLLEQVYNSDIDREVRDILIESLISLRNAIDNYRYTGSKGIRNATYSGVGAFVINRLDKIDNPCIKDFIALLAQLAVVGNFALNVFNSSDITKLLGGS